MTVDNLRGPRWEDHEDTILISLRAEHLSDTQIAARLPGRTKSAACARGYRLGIEPRPHPNFWYRNPGAEGLFMEMWHEGYSHTLIASRLGCSRHAISQIVRDRRLKRGRARHMVTTSRAGDWTPEEKTALTVNWHAGHSASQIAQLLPGRTRNSVIGQARRMGLPGRPSPIKRFQRPTWRRYVPHLFKGRQDACEYPDGCEEKAVKGSYCAFHHKLCYTGKPKKKGGQFALPRAKVWI